MDFLVQGVEQQCEPPEQVLIPAPRHAMNALQLVHQRVAGALGLQIVVEQRQQAKRTRIKMIQIGASTPLTPCSGGLGSGKQGSAQEQLLRRRGPEIARQGERTRHFFASPNGRYALPRGPYPNIVNISRSCAEAGRPNSDANKGVSSPRRSPPALPLGARPHTPMTFSGRDSLLRNGRPGRTISGCPLPPAIKGALDDMDVVGMSGTLAENGVPTVYAAPQDHVGQDRLAQALVAPPRH